MTYTPQSRWLDQQHPPVAVAAMQAWFEHRGRQAAPTYGANGQYTPVPPDLAALLHKAVRKYVPVVVDVNLAAAQIDEETAGWQSYLARVKLNPGGIGAEDDDPIGKAQAFDSLEEALDAFVAHQLTYAAGRGPWNAVDPRFEHVPTANVGTRQTVGSFAGAWATQPLYGEFVSERANNLLAFAASYQGGPMVAQIPGFTWAPADANHFTRGRSGKKVVGGAQHYSAGVNSLPWLTTTSGVNSGEPVSAHLLIKHEPTMEDRGWQMVRFEDTAWATGGQANPIVVAIEYEHTGNGPIPDIAYAVMAQTWVDVDTYLRANNLGKIDLTRASIKGHKEWVNQPDRVCPDGIDIDRVVREAVAAAHEPNQPIDPSNPWYLHLGGGVMASYPFRWGFRGVVEGIARQRYPEDPNSAALAMVGEPKEEEWEGENGHAYQRCKNLTLHYIPGQAKPWDVIFERSGMTLPKPRT